MGGAGRESFAPAYGGADDQNVEYNTNIGEEEWEEVSKPEEYSGEGQDTDIDGDIRARQGEEGGQLTGVVVDSLGLTEVQVNSQKHNDDCIKRGQTPRNQHEPHTELVAHHLAIEQLVADCSIAVIGHGREQTDFSPWSNKHKEDLSQAALYGDSLPLRQEVLQELGHSDRGEAEV